MFIYFDAVTGKPVWQDANGVHSFCECSGGTPVEPEPEPEPEPNANIFVHPTSISGLVYSGDGRWMIVNASGGGWLLASKPAWVLLSKSSDGEGESDILVSVTDNTGNIERAGDVVFRHAVDASKTATLAVMQAGTLAAPAISVSPIAQNVPDAEGTVSVLVTVTSGGGWIVNNTPDWLSLSQTSGDNGQTTVTVSYQANTGMFPRTGEIVFRHAVNNALTATMIISQSAVEGEPSGDVNFIAIGSLGKVAHSSDGENWTIATMGIAVRSIAYGNGMFVAVGNGINISGSSNNVGKAAYSYDGENWTDVTIGINYFTKNIVFGNGRFIAVDIDGKVAYSSDGENWTITTAYARNAISFGNGKFVTVGTNRVAYSSDGVNWTEITVNGSFDGVTYGNGKFVAVGRSDTTGTSGKMAYSSDGENWTTISAGCWLQHVTFGNGKFIAVGTLSRIAYSTDGINWTILTVGLDWKGVTYSNGKFVAAGYNQIAYSTDGINWNIVEVNGLWNGVASRNE
jgi:hypothetical protein